MQGQPSADARGALPLRELIDNALCYWELRRIPYNLVLAAVVLGWVVMTWPHFRPALNFSSLLLLFVLAVLANVCYCAAYLVDLPLQYSSFRERWLRWRAALWVAGMLFATILANYWIADEIFPAL
jgi:hypothetical protein